jgi:hypothetical protein
MADFRDQLKKAGLLSEKQARQAKHQERLHAAQVGHSGIEAERRAAEEKDLAEAAARKEADRKRAEEQRQQEREAAAAQRLGQLIRGGWIREATAGSRRFFFITRSGRIGFLDLSDIAARRLAMGAAAIVETQGLVRGEYCVVSERAATELAHLQPEMVRFFSHEAGSGHAGRDDWESGGRSGP